MKGTLEFNLPDEEEDFIVAQKGGLYKTVIEEFDRFLRDQVKYQNHEGKVLETYQNCRDKLFQFREAYLSDKT